VTIPSASSDRPHSRRRCPLQPGSTGPTHRRRRRDRRGPPFLRTPCLEWVDNYRVALRSEPRRGAEQGILCRTQLGCVWAR
jgi:hypothetical protein